MSALPSHTDKYAFRQIIAAGMTLFYLSLVFSPLVSFAMHGTKASITVTRECTGDCNLCGCSPESRASNTCCCSKKRQQQAHTHEDDEDGTADCCKKKPAEKKTVIACCCPCGGGKQTAMSSSSSFEVLPYHFTESLGIPHSVTSFSPLIHRLTTRLSEPPVPPPKLA